MSKSKNILFITAHPAPYWDTPFNELSKTVNLSVIYIHKGVKSKPWLNQEFYSGTDFNSLNIRAIFKLIKVADQIIICGYYLWQLKLLILLSKLADKPLALFTDVPEIKRRGKIEIFIKKQFFKLFNLFLISGNQGIDYYNKVYKVDRDRCVYFPYGWNNGKCDEVSFQDEVKVVFVSNRFIQRKGYDVLLKAICKLKELNIGPWDIRIAGDGPDLSLYREGFTNLGCSILGWISYDEYISHLNECHVFIHSSKFEPFGVPVLDALCRGKIVICSDMVMSGADFIVNDENGFLYNSTNHLELVEILLRISVGEYDLKGISRNAKSSLNDFSFYAKNLLDNLNRMSVL